MLPRLVESVRGLWIRAEQSERIHDQQSPTGSHTQLEEQQGSGEAERGQDEGGRGEQVVVVEEVKDVEESGEQTTVVVEVKDVEESGSELRNSKASDAGNADGREETGGAGSGSAIPRSSSTGETCRICQNTSEEPLIELGCACRGGLAVAHRTCIDAWFARRGTNDCEICKEICMNVLPPMTQPGQFWVWRLDGQAPNRFRIQPLWVALVILVSGLLFDVLISIFLGASALPVNIIIGVLIFLGVTTILRLVLECWRARQQRRNRRVLARALRPTRNSNPPSAPTEEVYRRTIAPPLLHRSYTDLLR